MRRTRAQIFGLSNTQVQRPGLVVSSELALLPDTAREFRLMALDMIKTNHDNVAKIQAAHFQRLRARALAGSPGL